MHELSSETTPSPPRRPSRAALWFGVVGTAWVALHATGALGPRAGITFVLLGAAAAVAFFVGIRRNKPALRWPWVLILSTMLVFLAGGALRQAMGTLGDLSHDRSLL